MRTTKFTLQATAGIEHLLPGTRIPFLNPSTSYVTTTTTPTTSAWVIHGVLRPPLRNKVVWTMHENEVEKSGVPRTVEMSVRVQYVQGRRFLMRPRMKATLVKAKEGGPLGPKEVLVVTGGEDQPVYFYDRWHHLYGGRVIASCAATTAVWDSDVDEDEYEDASVDEYEEAQEREMTNLRGGMIGVRVPARRTIAGGDEEGSGGERECTWRWWVPIVPEEDSDEEDEEED
ncbi:hypothetical protein BDZ91DRAFT_737937, partial [Kalaharituber pfeilii]